MFSSLDLYNIVESALVVPVCAVPSRSSGTGGSVTKTGPARSGANWRPWAIRCVKPCLWDSAVLEQFRFGGIASSGARNQEEPARQELNES